MFNHKTILITGGAGFIGSNIAFYLQQHYPKAKIVVFDCFRNEETFSNGNPKSLGHYQNLVGFNGDIICGNINFDKDLARLNDYKFDYVFHQAAISDTRVFDQEIIMRTNVNAFYKLLKMVSKYSAKLVYASSAATYGQAKAPQFIGDDAPENAYGFSKYAMDQIATKFSKLHPNMVIIGLRFFNVYGPSEYFKGKTASMVLQLGQQILAGKNPHLFTGSEQIKRDFIYIDDVVKANIEAAQSGETGIYNVGTGISRSFVDVVDILQQHLDSKLKITFFDNPYTAYQMHTQAGDPKNISTEYHSLEEGIANYMPEIRRTYNLQDQ